VDVQFDSARHPGFGSGAADGARLPRCKYLLSGLEQTPLHPKCRLLTRSGHGQTF